jgi:hypothetical protein
MRTAMTAVLVGLVLAGASVGAQSSPKAGGPGPKAPPNFVGEWEGAYQTDHGPNGPMSMRISKDSVWKATADVVSGSQTIPTVISDVSVQGNTITWAQEIMGLSCKTSAVLDGVELKGTTDCGHASMTIVLKKK